MRKPKEATVHLTPVLVEAPVWLVTLDTTLNDRPASDFAGAYVRLVPEAGVPDAEVKAVVAELRQHAAAVKVMPAKRLDRLVLSETAGATTVTEQVALKPRAFVLGLVERSTSKQKEALKSYIGELADKEGL